MIVKVLFNLSLCISLFLPTNVFAKKPKITLKVASVTPEGTPWAEIAKKTKKSIIKQAKKKLPEYKIRVKTYMGGVLGGEKSIIRRVKRGQVDIFGGTVGAMATDVPELGALELPYLFNDYKNIDYVLDNIIQSVAKEVLLKKGYIFMMWGENGFRHLANNTKQIKTVNDIKGLKIRSQESQLYINTYKAWGASPVPIAIPEVLSALQTGVVDSYDQTLLFVLATSWYTTSKYLSLTKHIYQPGIVVASKLKYDKYPKPLQEIVVGDWSKIRNKYTKKIRSLEKVLIERLEKTGVEIYQPNKKELETFKKGLQVVYDKFRKKQSPLGKKLMMQVLVHQKKINKK